MSEIILLSSFNVPEDPVRAAEYEKCLERNCRTNIDRIIVLFEGRREDISLYPSLSHRKVEVVHIEERPLLSVLFKYANEHLSGNFVILSNADIYFQEYTNFSAIHDIKRDHMWALTRYNLLASGADWELEGQGMDKSYDSYVFLSPIREFDTDFLIGAIGSDACLVHNALIASVPVADPCLSLITRHVDKAWYQTKYVEMPSEKEYWKYWKENNKLYQSTKTFVQPSRVENIVWASPYRYKYLVPLQYFVQWCTLPLISTAKRISHFCRRPYYRKRVRSVLRRTLRRHFSS